MDILFQGNVTWLLLALFCSGGLLVIYYTFIHPVIIQRTEKEEKFTAACEDVLSKISSEWIFVEQLEDILFAYVHGNGGNNKTLEALTYLYGDKILYASFELLVVEKLLDTLEKSGCIERSTVIYSRDTLQKSPEIFSSLPTWVRDQCEKTLLVTSSNSQGEELIRVRKISHEGSLTHSMMKDIGMDARVHLRSLE